ncbi:hypothetical protein CDAR_462841 [Caerostris darwini]|uniref:Uncharacterized protein n=1 Tax=Caerostris darwini TaxID=1538125 RepID=A0AAV4R2R2_9ARAC|nr:hypothetical protein CDAR_462841 [Caerostris darwini]
MHLSALRSRCEIPSVLLPVIWCPRVSEELLCAPLMIFGMSFREDNSSCSVSMQLEVFADQCPTDLYVGLYYALIYVQKSMRNSIGFTSGCLVPGGLLLPSGIRILGLLITSGIRVLDVQTASGIRIVGLLITSGIRVLDVLTTNGIRILGVLLTRIFCPLMIFDSLGLLQTSGNRLLDLSPTGGIRPLGALPTSVIRFLGLLPTSGNRLLGLSPTSGIRILDALPTSDNRFLGVLPTSDVCYC